MHSARPAYVDGASWLAGGRCACWLAPGRRSGRAAFPPRSLALLRRAASLVGKTAPRPCARWLAPPTRRAGVARQENSAAAARELGRLRRRLAGSAGG